MRIADYVDDNTPGWRANKARRAPERNNYGRLVALKAAKSATVSTSSGGA
jgi:hypothetical protein